MNAAHVTAWLSASLFPLLPADHKTHFTSTVCARFAREIAAGNARSMVSYLNWTNTRSLALEPAALVALFQPVFRTVRSREEGGRRFSGETEVHSLDSDTSTIVTHGEFVLAQTWLDRTLHLQLINLAAQPPWASDMLFHLLRERLMPWPILNLFHLWLVDILVQCDATLSTDFAMHNQPYARNPDLWTGLLGRFDPDAARESDMMDQSMLRLRAEIVTRFTSIDLGCRIRVWRLSDGRRFWMASDATDNVVMGTCDERGRIQREQGPFAR